jgi:hypothetical protein
MTSVPSNMPYTTYDASYSFPTLPGAFMISGTGSFPIFCNIARYDDRGMVNIDNYYIIMPGFILIIYSGPDYTNSSYKLANSTTDILYVSAPFINGGSACKLYFGDLSDTNQIKISGIS